MNGMDIGFNILEKREYRNELFNEKMSIIEFLRQIYKEENLPRDFAIFGLEELLYCSEDPDKLSKEIWRLLTDAANFLTRGYYIIQIVIDGKVEIIEDSEKPVVNYKNKRFRLYPIFGRVKQKDLKHFIAPLNLQS